MSGDDMHGRNALVTVPSDDDELIDVLVNSLYPGARRESAALVLGYCRAAGLDPMLKPAHIVPMRVKTGMKDKYGNDESAMRDTIMPGIGLYRVQAARTGQYAGQDEPKWGPPRTLTYQKKKVEWVDRQKRETWVETTIEYPEWCSVTVYRLVGGLRVAFTAVEFWTENYATAGRDTDAPNEMWARRTRGQLSKCAESQALRKGFPEVGSQPTAEEMEGRVYEAIETEAPPEFAPKVMPRRMSESIEFAPTKAERPTNTAEGFVEPVEAVAQAGNVATPAGQPHAAAPPPPAPVAEPEPSGNAATPPTVVAPPALASEGERKNALISAKARKVSLAEVLADLRIARNSETLEGLTKTEFTAIKAALA